MENPIDISYDHTESGLFKGIIQHLTEKCGGNVHLEGLVNIIISHTSNKFFFNFTNVR